MTSERSAAKENSVGLKEILFFLAFLALWYVLNRFVLPRFGVST